MRLFQELPIRSQRSLRVLAMSGLLFWLSITLLLPALPLYIQKVGGTKQEIGFVMGAFAVGLLPSRIWLGPMADRQSRKIVLIIGGIVAAIAPLGYLLVNSIPLLMAIRAFHGISVAAITIGYSALVADLSPPQQRGELIGYMSLVQPIGMLIGPAIGGSLQDAAGYTYLFILSSYLGVLTCIIISQVREKNRQILLENGVITPSEQLSLWQVVSSPKVRVLAFIMLSLGIIFGSIISFVPLFIKENQIDFNVGLFYSTVAIVSFTFRLTTGRVADQYGRGLFITIGIICYFLSMLTLTIANSAPIFFLAAALEGIGAGTIFPMVIALIADRCPPQKRGQFLSVCLGSFDLGGAISGPLLGAIAESVGYRNMFTVDAFIALVALAVFITLSSKNFTYSWQFAIGKAPDIYAYTTDISKKD